MWLKDRSHRMNICRSWKHFVTSRTEQVLHSNQHYAMRPYFEAAAVYYKTPEKQTQRRGKGDTKQ